MITKMVLQTEKQSQEEVIKRKANNMNSIKWSDKFLSDPAVYMWVYSKGLLISTNNRKSRSYINAAGNNEWNADQDSAAENNLIIKTK